MIEQEDITQSEYGATPAALLTFSPAGWGAVESLKTELDLATHNFLGMPDADALHSEHASMMELIAASGGKVLDLADLLDTSPEFEAEAKTNPNLFFTRDSRFAAPFLGSLVVSAQMGLPARSAEPSIVAAAVEAAGYEPYKLTLPEDAVFEGGDAIAVSFDGVKTILLGIGERTSFETAQAMINELDVDQVIAIYHPNDVLHLDTGLSLYPGAAIVAEGMFEGAVQLTKGKMPVEIDMNEYLKQHGFDIFTVSKQAAIDDEVCNVLPLGDNTYVGFEEMGGELIKKIEDTTGSKIHTTPGGELALATGGVHCSTGPLYGPSSN